MGLLQSPRGSHGAPWKRGLQQLLTMLVNYAQFSREVHGLTTSSAVDFGQSFSPMPLIDEITLVRCSAGRESFRKWDKFREALGPEANPLFHTHSQISHALKVTSHSDSLTRSQWKRLTLK